MEQDKRSIKSISDFIKLRTPQHQEHVWFRGQKNISWDLQPSLYRPPQRSEDVLLRRFQQHSVAFLSAPPRDEWDWMFLMQHYSISTRLLDWTENPLVALYFASDDASTDGALWELDPIKFNAISSVQKIPSFGVDNQLLDAFLLSRLEAPPADRKPIAILAQRRFQRLIAQQGVFTIFHKDNTPINKMPLNGMRPPWKKFSIPKTSKPRIRKELAILGIDELSLFPELEKVATRIREIEA